MQRQFRETVPVASRGERLDQYLTRVAPELTRSRIKSLVDSGFATIDGVSAKSSKRLKGGELVVLEVPAPESATPAPQELPLTVLYEDSDLIVLDKAAGMVVHPAAGNQQGTLVNALLFRVKDLSGVGGELRPGIVHRLDKGTSGCIVVAKGEAALVALQSSFKSHQVGKRYLAIVHGSPPEKGTFRTLYGRKPGRDPTSRKRFSGRVAKGKPAVTHFRVLERFEGASLVEVSLETGRTHQIRVHFSEGGFALLGDSTYGGARRGSLRVQEAIQRLGRPALHAAELSFDHPRTRAPMKFEAPLPDDFLQALEGLRSSQ